MATKPLLKKWIRTNSNFIANFYLVQCLQFVKCWRIFLELNSKGLYQSSVKEKESRLVFTSSTRHEIRQFHVVVVQRRQRNVQKCLMHVQSCCFANLNILFFVPFLLSSSALFKLPSVDVIRPSLMLFTFQDFRTKVQGKLKSTLTWLWLLFHCG